MLHLSHLFTDHAVLQRNHRIAVWGWASPFAVMRVTLAGVTVTTKAADDGKFLVRLPAFPAGGPHILTVQDLLSGDEVQVNDILIGEVWLAGGQSNMAYQVVSLQPGFDEARQVLPAHPEIRQMVVPRVVSPGRKSDVDACWRLPDEKTIGEWSAVASYFALKLQRELQVPVGIVNSNWGGTIAEAWTSRETLLQNPESAEKLLYEEAIFFQTERWDQLASISSNRFPQPFFQMGKVSREQCNQLASLDEITRLPKPPDANDGALWGWQNPEFDDSDWQPVSLPKLWSDFGKCVSGALWFRKRVRLPENWLGRDLELHLCGIDKHDITYCNGEEVGRTGKGLETSFWNTPRNYPVPARLTQNGELLLAVRNYCWKQDAGFNGSPERMHLCPADAPDERLSISGEWCYKVEYEFPRPPKVGTEQSLFAPNHCAYLFDNMIWPLIPYTLRGVIWYQGESDQDRAARYGRLMTDLIQDWRRLCFC